MGKTIEQIQEDKAKLATKIKDAVYEFINENPNAKLSISVDVKYGTLTDGESHLLAVVVEPTVML